MEPVKDPYKLLGVSRGASRDSLRKAYRRLVREHHPDANPNDPAAEERFKEIQQAYEILMDPEKRRSYDAGFHASPRTGTGGSRAEPGRSFGGRNAFPGVLADLLANLGATPRDSAGGRKEFVRELRGEDFARIAKLFGVDLTSSIAKSLLNGAKVRVDASFGGERPDDPPARNGAPEVGRRQGGANISSPPPWPPIPRRPPKPPRIGRPDDA